jgi:hypothetical protein
VNPNCTGTQTVMVPGLPDLHLQFIVAQSGNTIHQIVIDPGFATTAEGERIVKSKDWASRKEAILEQGGAHIRPAYPLR